MEASNDTSSTVSRRRLRLLAILGVAIVIGFVAWLILRDDDSSNSNDAPAPTAATVESLGQLPTSVGHPVYWAGRRSGGTATYELSRTSNGNIYIRYLPAGVQLGVPRPDYLTVGTYPFKNPVRALRRLARKPEAVSDQLKGGGIAVANNANAQNVYFAYPGEDVQVEVFHPQAGRALDLTTSGRIVPVG